MKEEYVKEWMDTYLQLFPDYLPESDYTEKMAELYPGNGRLEFSKEVQDGRYCYRYKVSGKKALSAVYAALPMKEEQIRGLLGQLIETLEDSREYLLREDDFLLEPSHIFVTFPQFQPEFCYVPGYGVSLKEQLESFMEYLLNRVDYDDKPAVELLYDCHTLCMKEEAGLEAIKRRLERKHTACAEKVKETTETKHTAEPKQVVYSTEPVSYLSWIKERLPGKWKRKNDRAEEIEREEEQETSEREERYPVRKLRETRSKVKPEPEPVWLREEDTRTVLLAVRKPKEEARLLHKQTGEIILLNRFPFYIGSAQEYATHALTQDGMSRLHFCIQKRENKYYLSDLNSTNGTCLNGEEITPGTEWELKEQDVIKAAGADFLFSCFSE